MTSETKPIDAIDIRLKEIQTNVVNHQRSTAAAQQSNAELSTALLPMATYVAQHVMKTFDDGRNLRYLGGPHLFIEYNGSRWKTKTGNDIYEMCVDTVSEIGVAQVDSELLASQAFSQICGRLVLQPIKEAPFTSSVDGPTIALASRETLKAVQR